jgi:hypothetical protein
MPDIPDIEPTSFIAGDTVKWTRDLSADYPVGTWTLTYYFRGQVAKTVVCTTSGSLHLATILAADSASYPPGDYFVYARVSDGTNVYSIWSGTITVKENPAIGTSPQDRRSHVKKMLDAIEAMMEGNASREEAGYEIAAPGMTSRRIQFCTKADLIAFHSHYKQLYQQELNAARIAQGGKSRNRILTVFTR